jgi:hypothetical protein
MDMKYRRKESKNCLPKCDLILLLRILYKQDLKLNLGRARGQMNAMNVSHEGMEEEVEEKVI